MEKKSNKIIVGGRWNYQKQKCDRDCDYWFDGTVMLTEAIQNQIPEDELQAIIIFLRMLAEQEKGLRYLQIFTLDDGTKIYVFDQLSRSQSEIYAPEYHYCTILFPWQY